MSRKISNLRERILEVSAILFRENEYKNVDMRRISKEVGSAVGTIYNYFPNKETLYVEVFKDSWEKTLKKLDDITYTSKNPVEKAIDFVMEIYKGKEERKYLSKQVIFHTIKKDAGKNAIKKMKKQWYKRISDKMKIILREAEEIKSIEIEEKFYDELIMTMLISILAVDDFFGNKENAEEFIRVYIKKILSWGDNNEWRKN